jgi:hypothetical protein
VKITKTTFVVGSLMGLASSTAFSQSSITMYGEIDEGIHYQSNIGGGKAFYMDSLDGIDGSRWGLTGKEDLGGGLRAIFTLEPASTSITANWLKVALNSADRHSSDSAATPSVPLPRAVSMTWFGIILNFSRETLLWETCPADTLVTSTM